MKINNNFVYLIFIPCQLIALAALLALPWTFDLSILVFMVLGYILFPGIGSAVTLHRIYSHRSIEVKDFLKIPLLYISSLCLQGNSIVWTAVHRGKHHRFSDTEKDPHSPKKGFLVSYFMWIFKWQEHFEPKNAMDLVRDPYHLWFAKYYNWIIVITYLVIGLISWKFLLYAMIVPAVYAYHQESIVNWFCHQRAYGYRNFSTNDDSINNRVLGLLTWGQALHNNHHHQAKSFDFGKSISGRNEFDPAIIFKKVLEK
jgi:fatty-acid desaturase